MIISLLFSLISWWDNRSLSLGYPRAAPKSRICVRFLEVFLCFVFVFWNVIPGNRVSERRSETGKGGQVMLTHHCGWLELNLVGIPTEKPHRTHSRIISLMGKDHQLLSFIVWGSFLEVETLQHSDHPLGSTLLSSKNTLAQRKYWYVGELSPSDLRWSKGIWAGQVQHQLQQTSLRHKWEEKGGSWLGPIEVNTTCR